MSQEVMTLIYVGLSLVAGWIAHHLLPAGRPSPGPVAPPVPSPAPVPSVPPNGGGGVPSDHPFLRRLEQLLLQLLAAQSSAGGGSPIVPTEGLAGDLSGQEHVFPVRVRLKHGLEVVPPGS